MRDPRIDRYEELLAMSSRIANDLGCGSDPLEISAEVTRVVHERTELEAENARLREDRERLDFVLDEMYVYHGKVITKREQIDAARKGEK